jgi:predicted RND superfamily exporter protein
MESLGESKSRLIKLLVEHRWTILCVILFGTLGAAFFLPDMKMDRTLKDFYVSDAPEKSLAEKLHKTFDSDEYILVAIENKQSASDYRVLDSLKKTTDALGGIEEVDEALSLCNLRTFQKGDVYRMGPVLSKDASGRPRLPDKTYLDRLRKALPKLALLLSDDLRTVGILVRVNSKWRFHARMTTILHNIESTVRSGFPTGSTIRLVGLPVTRDALVRYNHQTAIMFGCIGLLVGLLASVYAFKSIRVAAIHLLSVLLCLVWAAALMTLLGIRINMGTSLSFGIILIVSAATIIHIVIHYDRLCQSVREPLEAMRQALKVVGGPCLMCALTTSVGFASIMVSSVPMVRQVGLIMSTGVLMSFVIVIAVAPVSLTLMNPVSSRKYSKITQDMISRVLDRMWQIVIGHNRACTVMGCLLVVLALAGLPRIYVGTDPMRLFGSRTPEYKNIQFIQENLSPIYSLEILVNGKKNSFKKSGAWEKVRNFRERLSEVPQVVGSDSLLSSLEHVHELIANPETSNNDLYSKPRVIRELLHLMSFSDQGKQHLRRYLDEEYGLMRMSVRLQHFSVVHIGQLIDKIRSLARTELADVGSTGITGVLAIYSAQVSELVRSQTISIILAITVITLLMIIQFRSVTMGLLSMIPNVLPLAVIFGIMGWFQIHLDTITVFAAAVTIGLSVDSTIHYLTHLKREMLAGVNTKKSIQDCLTGAYNTTARALTSTTMVLFLATCSLVWSPFQPIAYIGLLMASGILAALIGDLVFMPSVVLSIPAIERILEKEIRSQPTLSN